MILAEKILQLRKKSGWSQEELAEKCNVSRQSVSKWEGGISIPDLDKIILLSQLFGVTTDYLLKDTLELEEFTGTEEIHEGMRRVSLSEANTYMDLSAKGAPKMAFGVSLCILSPIPLLLLSVSENPAAVALGTILILLFVAPAVAIFIMTGRSLEAYEFLEREPIELEYGVAGIVSERSKNYEPVFTRGIVIGVTLCILCSVPLLVAAIMNAPAFTVMLMVSLLLAIVAVAVNLFIRVGMVKGSYDKLLQTGDYSPGKKKSGKLVDKISSIYWLLVTAGFLAYSFITNDWEHSWIVWPVAGVSFGVIAVICQLIQKEE